jgi:mRNA interferase MazF
MNTVIIAPLTSTLKNFPFRLDCDFQSHKGQIALDHIRSVDKSRLIKKIGKINDATGSELLHLLIAIFEL